MRVMLVSHRFPPDAVGGVERATEGLATHLRELDDHVAIVTRRPGIAPPSPRILREQWGGGIPLYRMTGGDVSTERFLVHHQRLERLFAIALLETRPEVVHFNHLIGFSPEFMGLAHRYGSAVVLSLHDFFFACPLAHLRKFSGTLCSGPRGGQECGCTCFAAEGPRSVLRWGLRTAYFRRLLRTANRLICPSTHVATYFEKYGADPNRMRIVRNAVANEILSQTAAKTNCSLEGPLTLAFSGTVVPHKGVHVILEALRVAELGDVRLRVLGPLVDSSYEQALRTAASAIRGLQIRFYGEYGLRDIPHLLADVDCAIVPSQVPETGGVTAQEALACGVPVIATNLGALPELVHDGKNGLVFDATRPARLASALRRLVTDRELLQKLRVGARATAVTSMATHGAAVRQVYEEAIADPQTQPLTGDREETDFLRNALLSLGFASTRPRDTN